jgi:transketolase C-terminal domain/subunit
MASRPSRIARLYAFGEAYNLEQESDVALVVHGSIAAETLAAARLLRGDGYRLSVSSPTVKPIDMPFLDDLDRSHDRVFVVEEHYSAGGLGEALASRGYRSVAAAEGIDLVCGDQQYLRARAGLDGVSIFRRAKASLGSH